MFVILYDMLERLKSWLKDEGAEIEFSCDFLDIVGQLTSEEQCGFIRKLVFCGKIKKQFSLTVGMFDRIINSNNRVDFPVCLALKILTTYRRDRRLLSFGEIYSTLREYGDSDPREIFRRWNSTWEERAISLFEKCHCSREPDGHALSLRRSDALEQQFGNQSVLQVTVRGDRSSTVSFDPHYARDFSERLKEAVPREDRNYNRENRLWEVQSASYGRLVDFILDLLSEGNLTGIIRLDGQGAYNLRKASNHYGFLRFCEGRRTPNPHRILGVDSFCWCGGRAIFKCTARVCHDNFESYTMSDMFRLLFSIDDENLISRMYGILNRFDLLLPHLFCYNCHHILAPARNDQYAAHRITRFKCENENCREYGEVIYINHCSACRNVIDSRESKRCSNGYVICNRCGVCCSSDQMEQRFAAGIVENLNLNYHAERNEFFCPMCGRRLEEQPLNERQENRLSQLMPNNRIVRYLRCPSCVRDDGVYLYQGVFPKNATNSGLNRALEAFDYFGGVVEQQRKERIEEINRLRPIPIDEFLDRE